MKNNKVYVCIVHIVDADHDQFQGVFSSLDKAKEVALVQHREGCDVVTVDECDLVANTCRTVLTWERETND